MVDVSKAFRFVDAKSTLIKGHTRIELTTVKTGEKKIVEHDNVFQSALLTAFLRSFGVANNNPFANSTFAGRPLWRNLCGGILLFRDEIQTPASYMPAGNLMVANGAYGVTNNATPSELGSYNSIESSTSGSNSLSFVYDWGTSQGNGSISCVCLTSETGGYIGYGNASGSSASTKNILENQNSTRADAHLYYNGKRIRIVNVNYTTKKITVAKGNDKITTASIFQNQNEETSEISYSGSPIGNGDTNMFARAISETEIAVFKSSAANNIQNGETAGILIYDASTNTARVQSITNTCGETITLVTNSTLRISKDSAGNYYFIGFSGNTLHKFDNTGTYVSSLQNLGGNSSVNGQIAPGLQYAATSGSAAFSIIDNGTARPTNGTIGNVQIMHSAQIDAFMQTENSYTGSNLATIAPYKNPLYLATINNLDSPVTKDSTQTMKVIYTLTEAS